MLQLMTLADLEALIASSGEQPVLVFKHSTSCPVSARAHREWEAFQATPAAGKVKLAWVRVIQERPVSLALAQKVGVQHESPQALLIKNGQVLWHASHRGITAASLTEAVSTL
ncbi:MAG TPA: bacillithiol system redox-active protein YtxJ [Symbiobacteriaceae bacterium]|nr:bacillithiol system redox-active protein YtxJ [Symbiobacteriaceae bacterium]